jgi:hypothetical protein
MVVRVYGFWYGGCSCVVYDIVQEHTCKYRMTYVLVKGPMIVKFGFSGGRGMTECKVPIWRPRLFGCEKGVQPA